MKSASHNLRSKYTSPRTEEKNTAVPNPNAAESQRRLSGRIAVPSSREKAKPKKHQGHWPLPNYGENHIIKVIPPIHIPGRKATAEGGMVDTLSGDATALIFPTGSRHIFIPVHKPNRAVQSMKLIFPALWFFQGHTPVTHSPVSRNWIR